MKSLATRDEELACRLRAAREAAGISQKEAAKSISRNRHVVTNLESGLRKVGALELLDLAELYGRPVGEFLCVAGNPSTTIASEATSMEATETQAARPQTEVSGNDPHVKFYVPIEDDEYFDGHVDAVRAIGDMAYTHAVAAVNAYCGCDLMPALPILVRNDDVLTFEGQRRAKLGDGLTRALNDLDQESGVNRVAHVSVSEREGAGRYGENLLLVVIRFRRETVKESGIRNPESVGSEGELVSPADDFDVRR